MKNDVIVEGWDSLKNEWVYGGYYDLNTIEGDQGAKAAYYILREKYDHVRYRRVD